MNNQIFITIAGCVFLLHLKALYASHGTTPLFYERSPETKVAVNFRHYFLSFLESAYVTFYFWTEQETFLFLF
jgi:hypothetical protein